jgi:amino acid transporter
MGLLGFFKLGTGEVVSQPLVLSSSFTDITSMCGLAFFLFIGSEFIVPISNRVQNARRNVPLGLIITLVVVFIMEALMVFGFHNYTPWADLGASTTPHILYGTMLLGNFGTIWMALVSICAVTGVINTIISSLAYIAAGMAKINLLPKVFMKTNQKGAPFVGILIIGGIMAIINATGLSTTSQLSLLILTGVIFWMVAYIVTHLNVLVLRKRLPKAPRTFKVPFGPVIPIIGSIGIVWMIYNISSDPATRMTIYSICGIIFAALTVYSVVWVKNIMKLKLFKPIPLEKVMAMENDLYHVYHNPKSGNHVPVLEK